MIPNSQTNRPRWLTQRLRNGPDYEKLRNILNKSRLHTVCQEACCPNLWECFSSGIATFMIMGSHCTRNCRFCAVSYGTPDPPDSTEPARVAIAVQKLQLSYVVITSVTRDDLTDGGAYLFAQTVRKIRQIGSDTLVEVLIPDFKGDRAALKTIVDAQPNVVNHNIETVPRLYAAVRPQARYRRSLELLKQVKKCDAKVYTKSGLMLGLGEASDEVYATLQDLQDAGCRLLTLGQYLQPTQKHLPVKRFVHPEEFDNWHGIALEMGFAEVASGPFVRSSYKAQKLYQSVEP
jgi:lipoic acid synthetase